MDLAKPWPEGRISEIESLSPGACENTISKTPRLKNWNLVLEHDKLRFDSADFVQRFLKLLRFGFAHDVEHQDALRRRKVITDLMKPEAGADYVSKLAQGFLDEWSFLNTVCYVYCQDRMRLFFRGQAFPP
jgi:hypothetical protein